MVYDLALYYYEFCQLVLRLFGKDRKKIGWDLVPKDRACVVVSNHQSLLDAQSVSACFSHSIHVHWLANPKLYNRRDFVEGEISKGKNPLIVKVISYPVCFVVRNSDTIPNDSLFLKSCVEALKRGEVVCLFPSGTRGECTKVSRSFVTMAAVARVGILAVHTDKKEVRITGYYEPEEVAQLRYRSREYKEQFARRVMGLDSH